MGKRSKRIRNKNKKAKKQLKVNNMNKTNFVSKQSCHTGHNLVFRTQCGIEVWAGGRNRNGGWQKMNPPPQLAMGPSETLTSWSSSKSETTVPEGWSCEQHLDIVTPPLMLSLDWPDFSIPNVNKYFWYAVIDDIREHDIKTVSTQCAGGHGRTGVQLAILAYLLGTADERAAWPDAGVLIDWVREQHCVHAVEAKSQQQYIADVCDIPFGENKVSSHDTGAWGHPYSFQDYEYGGGSGKVITGTDKFAGLYIDMHGADYCPHCEHIPATMIINGNMCPKCGLDPQADVDDTVEVEVSEMFKPTDTEPKLLIELPCECCDAVLNEDSDICIDCGFDNSVSWNQEQVQCSHCGDMYNEEHTLDGTCFPCLVDVFSLKKNTVKVKMDKGMMDMKVLCSKTSVFVPSKHIKRFDTKENAFVSYKGDMKKELKQ